ncbi:MAG: hypothetical protein ACREV5_18920 [Steroidobacter sp.]
MRTKAGGESPLLLLDAIQVLRSCSIDYAVIGAMAAAVHGVVRASMDADVVLALAVPEAVRLHDAFGAAGFRTEFRRGDFDDPIPALLELKDDFENRVDLLIGLKGMDPETFRRAIEVTFDGEQLRVVCREDFIAMKLFAGGPQDLLDAKHARSVDQDTLDAVLLRRVTQQYGAKALANLEQLLAD